MRQEAFAKPAIAIVDGARSARAFVNISFNAASLHTYVVNRSAPELFPIVRW